MKKDLQGDKDRDFEDSGDTTRHKPPCLSTDLLKCNQQVRSVISSVIIFRPSDPADGQITERRTSFPHFVFTLSPWSLQEYGQSILSDTCSGFL